MTDRFEEAVREAVQGLPSSPDNMPSYHGAWNRGRRRRLIKRSALAAAGVCVFVAALTVNLGRLPGSGTTEIDDIATGLETATAVAEPTPIATTSPIETPDPSSASSVAPALPIPAVTAEPAPIPTATASATASEPAPTAPPVQEPTAPAASPSAVPTTAPAPSPTATPVPEAPTAVPTPLPADIAGAEASGTGPAEPGLDDELPAETDPDQAAGTAQQPADPATSQDPALPPQVAFTGPGPADAVVLDEAPTGAVAPCDLDGDFIADASCELLSEYACTGDGDVRPGYTAVDSTGDQLNDTCIALDITSCDTLFDGQGDTPCIIELLPTPEGESTDG